MNPLVARFFPRESCVSANQLRVARLEVWDLDKGDAPGPAELLRTRSRGRWERARVYGRPWMPPPARKPRFGSGCVILYAPVSIRCYAISLVFCSRRVLSIYWASTSGPAVRERSLLTSVGRCWRQLPKNTNRLLLLRLAGPNNVQKIGGGLVASRFVRHWRRPSFVEKILLA